MNTRLGYSKDDVSEDWCAVTPWGAHDDACRRRRTSAQWPGRARRRVEPLKVDGVSCRSSDMSVAVGVVRDRCWLEPPQWQRAVCTYPRGSVVL
jgi:hypothetical protein